MCGVNRRESTDPLFSKLEIMKFPNLNLLLASRFMFQLNRGEDPDIFSNFFTRNTDVHGYSTHQHHHLHVPCERSKLRQFSIRYRGAIVWNSILKFDINPDTSEAVFVKWLKMHYEWSITNISIWYRLKYFRLGWSGAASLWLAAMQPWETDPVCPHWPPMTYFMGEVGPGLS